MTSPLGDARLTTFDRFEEYKIVVQNYAAVQSRRQTATNLFLSFNLAFIGAVGFLILVSHLNSWWAVGALGTLTVAVMPINLAWYRAMVRYEYVIFVYYRYLQEIELELRQSQEGQRAGLPEIGVYLRQGDLTSARRRGVPRAERRLAIYFLLLYPVITVLTAVLTYLVANHLVLPPSFGALT